METFQFPGANMEKEPTTDLLNYTLRVFQPRTTRVLTREDARQFISDMAAFFRVLEEQEKSKSSEKRPQSA